MTIRPLYLGADRAYAVPLNGERDQRYLLPSALRRNGRGEFGLDGSPDAAEAANLKVRLLVHPDDQAAQRDASAYLALVFRASRDWFLRTQANRYGQYEIDWSANLGIPSAGYDDDDIQQAFRNAATAGWWLSLEGGPITEERIDAAWRSLESDGADDPPVEVIPEVIAAAAGYARSRRATEGLHLLVDVGASTLDLCAFGLVDGEEGQRFALYSSVVEHLGAAVLHRDRVRVALAHAKPGHACTIDPRDPRQAVPDELASYVGGSTPVPEQLRGTDEKIAEECAMAARTVLMQTWKKNPRSRQWREGVPAFLCGGGGQMKFYQRAMRRAVDGRESYGWSNIRPASLEMPSDLEAAADSGLQPSRMVVAYGLSFNSVDLGGGGGLVRPQDIPDLPQPPRRRMDDGYVSKDMV